MRTDVLTDALALLALAMLMIWLGWTGYHGVDDLPYAIAAAEWAAQGPHVGGNHWALRLPHVVSISISFTAFGINDFSLVLPTSIYFLALLILTYVAMRTALDRATALVAAGLLAVTPGFAGAASVANPELVELFFVACSVWLFLIAKRAEPQRLLFLSGLAAGIGWLTRETAVSVAFLYALLFLVGYRFPRQHYLALAAGFGLVAGAEVLAYAIATGDPLYRLHVDLSHGECTPAAGGLMMTRGGAPWLLAPFMVLAGEENTVLLCLSTAAAFLVLTAHGRSMTEQRQSLMVFGALAVLHFVVVGYALGLTLLARYYLISVYAVLVMAAIAFVRVYRRRRRYRPFMIALGLVLLSSSLSVTAFRSWDRVWGARVLADFVHEQRAVVHTDPATQRAVTFFLLEDRSLARLVRSDPAPEDAIYFFDGARRSRQALAMRDDYFVPDRARERWQEIWRANPPPSKANRVVETFGLEQLLPEKTAAWLDARTRPVVVYRVAGADSAGPRDTGEPGGARPERCDPWRMIR